MQLNVERYIAELTLKLLDQRRSMTISVSEAEQIAGIGKTQIYDRIKHSELPQSSRGRFYLPLFLACLADANFLRKIASNPNDSEPFSGDSELSGELPDNTRTWINQARKR